VTTGVGPISVAIADLNRDGKLDLAVANQSDNTISIFNGNGDGTFVPNPTSSTFQSVQPTWIVAGDFNQDGSADLAIANNIDPTVSVFLGNGDGTFFATSSPPLGRPGPVSIGLADFNSDGRLDFSELNSTDKSVSVGLGVGDGSFTAAGSNPITGKGAAAIAAADFNADGKVDLALVNQLDNTVTILLGIGDGTFLPNPTLTSGTGPVAVVAGDFNGDGKVDLATANTTANTVSLFLGNGDGTFQAKVDYATGTGPTSVAVGDFNGDGSLELAVTNGTANSVSILKQTVTGPNVCFSPTSLTFASILVGKSSPTKNVTLTNCGTAVLSISSILPSGDYSQTNNCPISPSTLGAGASCTITVTFTPTTSGLRNGTISVTDNAPGSPQTVRLQGRGTYLQIQPGTLNFGNQPVGTTSNPKPVSLKNTGTVSIPLTFAITGDYAQTNNCGTSLAAGATCTSNVTFTPTQTGTRTGSLSITDGNGGGTQKVNLTGNGT
jgi:hypothetical protein